MVFLRGHRLHPAQVRREPRAPRPRALLLGGDMERNLRRAMSISDGDWSILIASPISIGLYILTAGFLALSVWLAMRDHKADQPPGRTPDRRVSAGYDLTTLALFSAAWPRPAASPMPPRRPVSCPSAVSRRIADLEAHVGTALLRRHRRGVEVTQAGRDLARPRRGARPRRRADGGRHGRPCHRPSWCHPGGRQQQRDLAIPARGPGRIRRGPPRRPDRADRDEQPEVLDAVRADRADLGVFSGLTEAPGLVTLPYRRDTLVVVTPADHPLARRPDLTLAEIAAEPFRRPAIGQLDPGLSRPPRQGPGRPHPHPGRGA